MLLNIQLNRYCLPAIAAKGQSLYNSGSVSRTSSIPCEDGSWIFKGKVTDDFNFTNRPWFRTDSIRHNITDFGCDCAEFRNTSNMCEHCAALYFSQNISLPDTQTSCAVPTIFDDDFVGVQKTINEDTVTESILDDDTCTEDFSISNNTADDVIIEEPVEIPEPVAEPLRSMEILFGKDTDDQPVLWCPNDTEQVFHTNMGILGTMGTGKTQFAKSLITQLYQQQRNNFDGHPLGILIFDYKGDYNETKTDFVQATKAHIFKPYRLPYNPLALNSGAAFKPLMPLHTANEFKDTISQIYGLGPKQEHLLLDCIVKAYRKQGIDPANPATWSRLAPTFDQVYDIFTAETEGKPADKLTTAMEKLHQFCIFENRPECAVSLYTLLDGVVVIDMAGYDNDIQTTIVAITLNQFYSRMQAQGSSRTDGQYRQLQKFIMVDEADTFMRGDFPSLRRIMKEGREFGVGVILSTQSLEHYIGNDDNYSRYVLTWIIHNVGDLKQRDVEYLFKLPSKSEDIATLHTAIKGLQKHESVVKLGNNAPFKIHNYAFYQLYQQSKL